MLLLPYFKIYHYYYYYYPHPYPDMVARFQSVISEELIIQLKKVEGRDYPDYIIACVGGGSNAAGIFYHYLNNIYFYLIFVIIYKTYLKSILI